MRTIWNVWKNMTNWIINNMIDICERETTPTYHYDTFAEKTFAFSTSHSNIIEIIAITRHIKVESFHNYYYGVAKGNNVSHN